jgi:predicted permease
MSIEHWFYSIPLKLRSLFRRKDVEQELDEELNYHFERRIEEERGRGMTAEEARYAALRAMQGLQQRKEECREARGLNFIDESAHDLRYAVRLLKKHRGFAAAAALSLALGIGANTAIFSLIDALLLRPLPVPDPAALVRVYINDGNPEPRIALTNAIFEQVRDRSRVFSGVFTWADHSFQMRSGGEMAHVNGAFASGDYFRTLGVPAILGRTFTAEDDKRDGGKNGPVAVISETFWSNRFARNPSAIGAGLVLDGVEFSIIGVMPQSFFGADVGTRPQIWVPLALSERIGMKGCLASRSCWWLIPMARLKSGVSLQQAQAQLKIISPQAMLDAAPDWGAAGRKKSLAWQLAATSDANGWTDLRRKFSNPLAVLMILVGVVLLIACANLSNMLLARASSRQREIAVRLAIGAGRGRLIRQLLTESVLLSLLGGAVGLAFAVWSTHLLVAFLAATQRASMGQEIQFDLHVDWRVALFTFFATVGSGLLFGLVPAIGATRLALNSSLKERAGNLQGTSGRMGMSGAILVLQAALSVVLISGAGLFAGSLWRLATLNPGFDPKNVVLIAVDTDKRPEKGAALVNLYDRLLQRVQAIPGVLAASVIWCTPLGGGVWNENVEIPGRTDLSEDQRLTYMNLVGPRFFEVMRTPLLSGREFASGDVAATEKVGIINEAAARRYFPGGNGLGGYFRVDGALIRIVGVVGNAKYEDLREPEPPTLYFPYTQNAGSLPSLNVLVKTNLGATATYTAFHTVLHDAASDVPIGLVETMQEHVDDSLGSERLMACLSVFFGVLALLLSAIGLYGILAYAVARRTGEIGVRMALGAQRHSVVILVVREAIGQVAIGIAVGVIAVLATSRLVATLLYGIRPNDPGNLLLAIVAFLLVAAAAAYLPARRASRLDPLVALREE